MLLSRMMKTIKRGTKRRLMLAWKYFHLQASFGCFIHVHTNKILFCLEFEIPREQSCWFIHEEQKQTGLWRRLFDTSATHDGLVRSDIIDTDCTQNKSTHGGVFAYFKRHKTNNCNAKKRLKNKNNFFLAKKTRNHEKKKKKKKTNAFQIPYL